MKKLPSGSKSDNKQKDAPNNVSRATASRLVLYLRELQQQGRSGHSTVRSVSLGKQLGINDSQVRRDLGSLGLTGRPGVGYSVDELTHSIRGILGTDRKWGVILIGVGHLGQALAGYRGFSEQGFHIVAAFDNAKEKIGTKVMGVCIQSLDTLEQILKKKDVQLAIVAVPAFEAQQVVDRLGQAGVEGILNFAPVNVDLKHGNMSVVNVDLALELQRLAFEVVKKSDDQ